MGRKTKGFVDRQPSTQTSSVDGDSPWNVHTQHPVASEEKQWNFRLYFLMLQNHTVLVQKNILYMCPYAYAHGMYAQEDFTNEEHRCLEAKALLTNTRSSVS